jgi:hypothetical protein
MSISRVGRNRRGETTENGPTTAKVKGDDGGTLEEKMRISRVGRKRGGETTENDPSTSVSSPPYKELAPGPVMMSGNDDSDQVLQNIREDQAQGSVDNNKSNEGVAVESLLIEDGDEKPLTAEERNSVARSQRPSLFLQTFRARPDDVAAAECTNSSMSSKKGRLLAAAGEEGEKPLTKSHPSAGAQKTAGASTSSIMSKVHSTESSTTNTKTVPEATLIVGEDDVDLEDEQIWEAQAVPTSSRFSCWMILAMLVIVIVIVIVMAIAVSVPLILIRQSTIVPDDEMAPVVNLTSSTSAPEQPAITLDTFLATVPETVCMERVPGEGWTTLCTSNDTVAQGGGVCNLVAQAFLDQVPTADVAIQNAGACRNDIAAGEFTKNNATLLLPFTNTLLTLQMPGAQIVLLLEQAMDHVWGNNRTGGYPYCAGLRYDVNATADFMSRVANVEVNKRLRVEREDSWRPIDMDQMYTVLANSYIVSNGDSYFALAEVQEEFVVETGKDATETFIDYAIQQGELLDPPRSEYSTRSFLPNESFP